MANATLWISPYDVALRTKQFIETIFRDKEENLFIVSHGTTIRTIIINWVHYSPKWVNSEPNMGNGSVRLIDADGEKYIYKGRVKK